DTLYLPKKPTIAIFKALLENTVHHHDRTNGHVTVASETIDDRVRITVEDDGPGIPKQSRQRMFESLAQLRRREETGRAGLGLTMARKLVTRLDGNISLVDASTGRGLAVQFDLPVRARW
ncbi:MAG: sensor histidine kinase, partial [Pseudomonadota bacterium]